MAMAMRAPMLEKIHSSHVGAEGCLRRSREVVFRPGISAEIRQYISSCDTCNDYRQDQPKNPLYHNQCLTARGREWLLISSRLTKKTTS